MNAPIDLIAVRGSLTLLKSLPLDEKLCRIDRVPVDHNDGTFTVYGYGDATDQSMLTGLGLTVTVVLTQAEMDQQLSDNEAQIPNVPVV